MGVDFKPKRCAACGDHGYSARVGTHHIRPREGGGDNQPTNLMFLCARCHDYIEEVIPLPHTRSGVLNALEVWIAERLEPVADGRTMLCGRHDDWRRWVYGGFGASPTCNCTPESVELRRKALQDLKDRISVGDGESVLDDPDAKLDVYQNDINDSGEAS